MGKDGNFVIFESPPGMTLPSYACSEWLKLVSRGVVLQYFLWASPLRLFVCLIENIEPKEAVGAKEATPPDHFSAGASFFLSVGRTSSPSLVQRRGRVSCLLSQLSWPGRTSNSKRKRSRARMVRISA